MLIQASRILLVLFLVSACSTGQPAPTLTPAPSSTPSLTVTNVPTVAPTSTTVPPTPTPVPFESRIDAEMAGTSTHWYVRSAPSTLQTVERLVSRSAAWQPVGRTADLQWLEVRFEDESIGWIANPGMASPAISDLPITGESQITANVALLQTDDVALYADNGMVTEVRLPPLTPLLTDARSADNNWIHVSTADGQVGWLQAADISPLPAPESLSIATFNPASEVDTVSEVDQADVNGVVNSAAGGLRLRQLPVTDSTILLNLPANTRLQAQGRTSDNAWLLIKIVEGYSGWVSAQYIDLQVELSTIPLITDPQPVPYFVPPTPEGGVSVTTGIGGGAVGIFQRGQTMGNRANIFTTVGDSLTDTNYFLWQIPNGFDLGGYGYLLPTINYFNVDTGYGPAFGRRPFSTRAGWSTFSVLEPQADLAGLCQPDELPIECEYRLTKPAFAIILIGTNDVPAFPAEQYRANMQRIVEISVERGVVPILSTLAPRPEFNDRVVAYNQVIFELGNLYGVPVIDLYSALIGLPNQGLHPDGVHLSIPPGAPATTMIFSNEYLQYGTTMRNLTALQTLEQIRNLVG